MADRNLPTDPMAAIRERDASWTANYANMHSSDGYGQAAADRRTLLGEIEHLQLLAADYGGQLTVARAEISRLRADIENLKSYTGVYSQGWRSPYARPADDVGGFSG